MWGPANALSPKYTGDVSRLWRIDPKPPVLWVRGDSDQIVSDTSLFDLGTLGALGAVPGYPGTDVYPSQPMVGQTRAVLEKYKAAGGEYSELVLETSGIHLLSNNRKRSTRRFTRCFSAAKPYIGLRSPPAEKCVKLGSGSGFVEVAGE